MIAFALNEHLTYPLIFAGNRDEFYTRPAESAHFWDEFPDLLAGRDLEAGGTWLGVTRGGRFATVTNYREPGERRPDARSRGEIVVDYLTHDRPPENFLSKIAERAPAYNGFNLIFGNAGRLFYLSNEENSAQTLESGIYALSNGRLDTPWPKVRRARELFREIVEGDVSADALLSMLSDAARPPDEELPATSIGLEWERLVSSIFIAGREYGTRASTVVLIDRSGKLTFVERSFGPGGVPKGIASFEFAIDASTHLSHESPAEGRHGESR